MRDIEMMNKLEVNIYGIVSEACHRVENKDIQWSKDPNHFLLSYARKIMECESKLNEVLK